MIQKLHIEKFRGFHNINCDLGSQITAIAGQNGTQKTVLLGILSQPFAITDKDNPMIKEKPLCGGNYKSDFANKFKFSPQFDLPKTHEWTLFVDDNDPFTVESIQRSKDSNDIRFWRKGTREKGSGYLQYPVIYLSLKRLLPIGEDNSIKESNSVVLSEDEIQTYRELHNKILISQDKVSTPQFIESVNKATLGVNTDKYDWRLNSAGQDNLGKIILALLSFKRLYERYQADYRGGILAIDELDSALYPASQIKLLGILRHYAAKYKIQILFTTHSLPLLEETCKEYSESQLHSNSKGQVQVLYLQKSDDNIILTNIKSFNTIKNRLNVTLDIEAPKKLSIYCEDDEAKNFLSSILPNKWHRLVKIEKCSLGCENYIYLVKKKIAPFLLPKAGIILDADASHDVQKIQWKSIGTKNILCLPGSTSPERELAHFLIDSSIIPDSDIFWTSLNKDYSRQVCFRDFSITDITNNRDKAKQWYKSQLPIWGNSTNKAVKLWASYNKEKVDAFLNDFQRLYNNFAENFELDTI